MSCCPESTRADISAGMEESEPALATSTRPALTGTRPWGRRRCLRQDPTPSPSRLIFPLLLITPGGIIPPSLPRASAASAHPGAGFGTGALESRSHHLLLPGHGITCCRDTGHRHSPAGMLPAAGLGIVVLSSACSGHPGTVYHQVLASRHWVPPDAGTVALGTAGSLASWHQGIQQVTASRKDGADVATRCRCAGTARLICRCLLANATGAPRVGWEQSLAGHSCVLKAKLIAGRVVGMVRTGRKRL